MLLPERLVLGFEEIQYRFRLLQQHKHGKAPQNRIFFFAQLLTGMLRFLRLGLFETQKLLRGVIAQIGLSLLKLWASSLVPSKRRG